MLWHFVFCLSFTILSVFKSFLVYFSYSSYNKKSCSPWFILIQCGPRINKARKSHKRSRYEHVRVESQPGKIQRDLDSKIFFDMIQRLITIPLSYSGPFSVQQIPHSSWFLQITLKHHKLNERRHTNITSNLHHAKDKQHYKRSRLAIVLFQKQNNRRELR